MAQTASQTTELEPPPPETDVELPASGPTPDEKLGFFELVRSLAPADWERHFAYVYRLAPITDKLASGGTVKYIRKYSGPFDEERMKHDDGSGGYRVLLNKVKPNGKSAPIKRIEFEIEDRNFPPKVPDGEWLDDERNERWAWARKKKDEPADATGQTMKLVREIIREMRPNTDPVTEKSVVTAVLDAVKETRAEMAAANDPTKMITSLKTLVETFMPKAAAPAGPPAADPLMTQLLTLMNGQITSLRTELTEERRFTREMMTKANKAESSEGGEPKGVRRILETAMAAMLTERLQGGGAAPMDWKTQGMQILSEQLPEAIGLVKSYFQTQGYKDPPAGRPAAQVARTAPPATETHAPGAPGAAETTMPTVHVPPGMNADQGVLRELLLQYGRTFVTKFQAGMPGADFADLIILMTNEAEYNKLTTMGRRRDDGTVDETADPKITREMILAVMRSIPEFWIDLTTSNGIPEGRLPELTKFITEFIDPPEEEDEPPAAAAAAPDLDPQSTVRASAPRSSPAKMAAKPAAKPAAKGGKRK